MHHSYSEQVASNILCAVFLLFSSTIELVRPIHFISASYLCMGLVLFMSLGWMVSTMIQTLGRRKILLLSVINHFHWCRCYGLIVELVNQISRCFGPLLLGAMVYYFIFLVNGTFYAMVSFRERDSMFDLAALLPLIIEIGIFPIFLFMLYVPHRITQKVISHQYIIYIYECILYKLNN